MVCGTEAKQKQRVYLFIIIRLWPSMVAVPQERIIS